MSKQRRDALTQGPAVDHPGAAHSVSGESAGGGLATALRLRLKEEDPRDQPDLR